MNDGSLNSNTPHLPPNEVGELFPNIPLAAEKDLLSLRGKPVLLAFSPTEWNPSTVYQSEMWIKLLRQFGEDIAFVDMKNGAWISFDSRSDLAKRLNIKGLQALFLLDEQGVIRWKMVLQNGQDLDPRPVLKALHDLQKTVEVNGDAGNSEPAGLSRRTFLMATLASAAVLLLPGSTSASNRAGNAAVAPASEGYDLADTVPAQLSVNGTQYDLQIETRVTLLDALREYLHITGVKKGCDHAQCGACTVHVNGETALSCLTLAIRAQGKEITTIEGLAKEGELHPVQEAFVTHDALQCGYCTPGQIMSATAFLAANKGASAAQIREAMSGNLCRCAAYDNIIAAIQSI